MPLIDESLKAASDRKHTRDEGVPLIDESLNAATDRKYIGESQLASIYPLIEQRLNAAPCRNSIGRKEKKNEAGSNH